MDFLRKFLEEGTSFPEISYPSLRKGTLGSPDEWVQGKVIDDGAEGLWRVNNSLYDFSDFVKRHPGGEAWLTITKGTDITEAFEAHHISTIPENMLGKFFVKEASSPRHSPFTFKEDGFYRTLKSRVREELKIIPSDDLEKKTHTTVEGLFIVSLLFAIASCSVTWLPIKGIFCIMTSFFVICTVNCAHNFIHRKDNWRMYFASINFLAVREWRVIHALSHHLYTNTLLDLEMIMFEPFFIWMPRRTKGFIMKYAPRFYALIVYIVMVDGLILKRLIASPTYKKVSRFELDDLSPFIIPILMFVFGKTDWWDVLLTWIFILHLSSMFFGLINFHAAHHHPEIFHDGDVARNDRDWGLFQVDAVADRVEVNNSYFMVMTFFGEHTLHHLFPTLDHSVLHKLHPIFAKTCEQFRTKIRMTNQLDMFLGYYRQLAKTEPKNFNDENFCAKID